MILLKKIQLHNFLSHENTTIDFTENEKALIDGSSGAGKSSIFDAIVWVLYGISRADNRSLIRKGTKSGFVCLELIKDSEVIVITRSVSSAGKHTLEIATKQPNGARISYPLSGVRELQNHIEKNIIGASYLLFVNSVAYVQGNVESFVTQTAPKRKELLLEIVKAEDYTKYYENAREKLSSLQNEQNLASGQLIELEASLKALELLISARNTYLLSISEHTKWLLELEPKIQELEDKKASFLNVSKSIDNLDALIKSAKVDVEMAEREISKKSIKLAEKPKLLERLSTSPRILEEKAKTDEKLLKLQEMLLDSTKVVQKRNEVIGRKPVVNDRNFQEVERKKLEIERIKENPKCPSGEACPYSGNHLKEIEKIQEQIKDIEAISSKEALALANWSIEFGALPPEPDLSVIMKDIGQWEKHIKSLELELKEIELIERDIKYIDEIVLEIPGLQKILDEKKTNVVNLVNQKQLVESSIDKGEMAQISIDLAKKKEDRDAFKSVITRANLQLENIEKAEGDVKTVNEKITSIKDASAVIKDNIRKVELVKQAFGSKGIETLVIDYLLPKLEDKVNEVLAKLSDFRVRIDTQKKSTDGESTVEGLFITIINEVNEEMPFEAYSGGEKLKISVSISEALATLQNVGFRLFDETFIGLDENSTESFTRVLQSLQQNFSQVLCISHLLQIKELFDKKIQIIKNNNISYVR